MRTSAPITDSAELAARALLRMVLARLGPREFAVQLWDGEQWPPEPEGPADFKLIFRSPNVVRSMFSDISSLSFGEAYIYGHLDVEGSLIDVFESGDRLLTIHYPAAEKLRLARWLWSIPAVKYPANGTFGGFARRNISTAACIRAAVNYHYDHPVDFWKLWLDESLSYSCAYFDSPEISLASAQTNKLDYICRKLRLAPGQRLLDMGCGWGALVLYAARHYGVQALGLTLSPQQAEVARERIRRAGLAGKCRVEVASFLDIRSGATFDRIASVGAAEHVPEKCFDDYFAQRSRCCDRVVSSSITRLCGHRAWKPVPAVRSWIATCFRIIFSPPSGVRSPVVNSPASKCVMSKACANTISLPWSTGCNVLRQHRTRSSGKQIHSASGFSVCTWPVPPTNFDVAV